jgi:hypothetical protein
MDDIHQNSAKTDEKQSDKPWLFKPGQSGNPKGRPTGAESFKTKFYRALEKIGEKEGKTVDELEEELFQIGFLRARKEYSYFKDLQDRVYGKPLQSIDHTTNGQSILPAQEHEALADRALNAVLNDEQNTDKGNTP